MRNFRMGDQVGFELRSDDSGRPRWDNDEDYGGNGRWQRAVVSSSEYGVVTTRWRSHLGARYGIWFWSANNLARVLFRCGYCLMLRSGYCRHTIPYTRLDEGIWDWHVHTGTTGRVGTP